MEPKKIELPKNDEELKPFLKFKASECNHRELERGLCYVNGFNAGMAYAMQQVQTEGKKQTKSLLQQIMEGGS